MVPFSVIVCIRQEWLVENEAEKRFGFKMKYSWIKFE